MFRKNLPEYPLNIKMDQENINGISKIFNLIKNIPILSAKKLLEILIQEGQSSILYTALEDYLSIVEGKHIETYPDSAGHMTIGIGFRLDQNGADAVIWQANNTLFDFFDVMKTKSGQPPGGISETDVDSILYWSLVGVNNEKGIFTGETQNLISQLDKYIAGLSELPFPPNILIALQSLAFNNPSLIGEKLCDTLLDFQDTNDERPVLLQISECSNKLYNNNGTAIVATNGIENRRLVETNMAAGSLAMRTTFREFNRISDALASLDETVVPQNGLPYYGLPFDEDEQKYRGGPQITTLLDCNLTSPNIYYGSNQNDKITVNAEDNPVVLAGDGDDMMIVTEQSQDKNFHYVFLAGNQGKNTYYFTRIYLVKTLILGGEQDVIELELDYCDYDKAHNYLNGPVIDGKMGMNCGGLYDVVLKEEIDGTKTLSITNFAAILPNFQQGDLGILWGGYSQSLTSALSGWPQIAAISPYGRIIINNAPSLNQFSVYDLTGMTRSFTVSNSNSEVVLIPTSDGNFWMSTVQRNTADDQLLASKIDGSVNNYILPTLYVAEHDPNCLTCDKTYIKGTVPLCLENDAIFVRTLEQILPSVFHVQCVINAIRADGFTFDIVTVSNTNYCNNGLPLTVNAWPVNQNGLLVNYFWVNKIQVPDQNKIVIVESDGALRESYTLAPNDYLLATGMTANGYVMMLVTFPQYSLRLRMYDGKEWLPDLPLASRSGITPLPSIFFRLLPNNQILMINAPSTSFFTPTKSIIVNPDNTQAAGPFTLSNSFDSCRAVTVQANGDTVALYSDQIRLKAVVLPTALSTEEAVEAAEQKPMIQENYYDSTTNVPETQPEENALELLSSETIRREWSETVEYDRLTGKPIFTLHLYENEHEIASASFYDKPYLCAKDGRHNLIQTTGLLSDFQITPDMTIDEVCDVLPPTLFDRIYFAAKEGAFHGLLRGAATIVAISLQTNKESKMTTNIISESLYYTSVFCLRFKAYYETLGEFASIDEYLTSAYQAAIETGQMFLCNLTFKMGSFLFQKASERLKELNFETLSAICKHTGNITRFGIFSYMGGVKETLASVASATAVNLAVEKAGRTMMHRPG